MRLPRSGPELLQRIAERWRWFIFRVRFHPWTTNELPRILGTFGDYIDLTRLNRPVGIWLLLWPTLWAVWIAGRLTNGSELWTSAAGVAVLLGHAFPVFLNFKGGKAVASFTGAFLYLAPAAVLAVFVVFVLAVWRTRFISMGSILGALMFPLAVWMIVRPHWPLEAASIIAAVLILWRHKGNLERLRSGTESLFSLGRSSLGRTSPGRSGA